ncbi:mechanosensitive ion channel family protein [Pseudaestuariivita atlantica]|uniref:Mechanosensitive ion channel protein MscS n=1 Tax=Pseudaestuariivita atlantica TaxID=1317121 RepID=A0A0L1JK35_9RHOB|nr:mechanosensitive ion channel family protein [Pseudaestuariivita atlantica]KNG92119.1 hypothetical protein ATO11_19165 [Pseudaestuariivita atlantica]
MPLFLQTLLAALFLALVPALPGSAQNAPDGADTAALSDPYGRVSPRGTVDGYLKAMREADPDKAALFLDLREVPKGQGARRATQLKDLLDDGGYFFAADEISARPDGNLADEMSADLEEVGALTAGNRDRPLILQRVAQSGGHSIWLFSAPTVASIPDLHRVARRGVLDRVLPEDLKSVKLLTVPVGHWLAILIVAGLSALVGYWLARLALGALDWLLKARRTSAVPLDIEPVFLPLGTLLAVTIYREAVVLIGIQVVARGAIDWIAVTILWLAFAVLCLKVVDLIADVIRSAVQAGAHNASIAALILMRKVAKAVILAVLTVQILEILGFDVTTAIAALGIGGLALALGAQKTVENLVGSVNVVADRPVEVGDFCRFGDVTGTVEDIGIRSTKVRTPERTIVTVPNGTFAAMQIENFAVRDQFLFNAVLALRCDTPAADLRRILDALRTDLQSCPAIAEGARVNLTALTRDSIEIEIYCYARAADYPSFLALREERLLAILATVSASDSRFAFPPRLVTLRE